MCALANIQKILIANRGEIAIRVARTARAMGIKTVAVYSEADRHAGHVRVADEAYYIGPSAPAESYLNIDAILQVVQQSGADAVHPGYGFLSENPEFAEKLNAQGIIFIGPSAEAIRTMGLKDAAKAVMDNAGVPTVPGYLGEDQSEGTLLKEACRIGFPILIKAVAGGGGKGMRHVPTESDFGEALKRAKSEALKAFGNDSVLLEKFIEKPRHIEIQVFGDGEDAVHLFERDCSLQRRYQKVIEEAPAPGMSEQMREAMGTAAVKAARAIQYKGAGTVEFIVDAFDGLRHDGFWFMEMNTRLQVEHPVTEAITGLDLVEWQIRIARGEPLPKTQGELRFEGHAIEARIYVEDVENGFLPATGKLEHVQFSTLARADTAVASGDSISPFYDPMIAKIIVKEANRSAALAKLQRALEETELAGSVTNIAFLSRLIENSSFQEMSIDTNWIDTHADILTAPHKVTPREIIAAALTSLGTGSNHHDLTGFHLWSATVHRVTLQHKDVLYVCAVTFAQNSVTVTYEQETYSIDYVADQMILNGRALPKVYASGAKLWVFSHGAIEFERVDPLQRKTQQQGASNTILAPMPGLITSISARSGERMSEGATLIVLEAMKMEHILSMPREAVIDQIHVKEGDQVTGSQVLISLVQED